MATLLTPPHHYLNESYGIKSWLLTRDHKRIALLYLATVTLFFFVGGSFAVLIRLDLATPAGDLVSDETYNKLFTMHGVMMVFFFLIPAIPSVLGNFLVPIMIGAKDLAFSEIEPRKLVHLRPRRPLHAVRARNGRRGHGLDVLYALQHGLLHYPGHPDSARHLHHRIFVNSDRPQLHRTIHRMRAPGMTWFRLPLFIWSTYATSLINVLGTPVIAITILLVAAERLFHFGFFNPAVGGDPVLFQHLFWFYSHPAVYIMVLPAMGVVSELVAAGCRKPVFGYKFVAFASLGIAVLGFLVWGHHMFVAGESVYAALIFLDSELRRRDSISGQGVQLDRQRCTRDRCRGKRRCCTPTASSVCSRLAD